MSRNLIKKLKSLKNGEVNPRAEWLEKNRSFLLSQIKNTIPAVEAKNSAWKIIGGGFSIFLPQKFILNVVRPLAILLLVVSVASSGWITTVDAAYETLPGDLLYPAKRAAEKARVTAAAIIGDKKGEAKLHSEYAKRRAVETKKIIADPAKKGRVGQSVADLKNEIKNVEDSLNIIKDNPNASDVADVAKEMSANTEQVKNVLQEVKDDLTDSTAADDLALSKEISETKEMAKDVTMKAVEVVVTKHLEGDNSVTSEEVKNTINKFLQNVTSEAIETGENMDSAIEAAKSSETAVKPVLAVISTSTPTFGEGIGVVTTAVAEKVAAAREFLVSGDLAGAVSKLIEANAVTTEAEKINDIAQSVAPTLPAAVVISVSPSSTLAVTSTAIIGTSTPSTSTSSH